MDRKFIEDIHLDENFTHSLSLYTILKNLIQSRLSEIQLIKLKEAIYKYKDELVRGDFGSKLKIINDSNISKPESAARYGLSNFMAYNGCDSDAMWFDFVDCSIDLLLIKKFVLDSSKKTMLNYFSEQAEKQSGDYLSLAYDLACLSKPYGVRVASSLLVHSFDLSNANQTYSILNSPDFSYIDLAKKLNRIGDKYSINIPNVFSLLMLESVNQGIISDAGNSYEDRAYKSICKIVHPDLVTKHLHDSFNKSIEYDFQFIFEGKKFGVSAKRTVRERYKQNLQSADLTDVDFILLITLGTDINESKLNNILSARSYYVVVAKEIYNSRQYFSKAGQRVIPSDQFNGLRLHRIIGA